MSEQLKRKRNDRNGRRAVDTKELVDFLAALDVDVKPDLHVNGHHHPTAILVVDFGQPLKPVRLSPEQATGLTTAMTKLTREVLGRDIKIRVSVDNSTGIYWSSLA